MIADAIMDQPIEVTATVMLELGWVMTSAGRMSRDQFADAALVLLTVESALIANRERLRWAIDRYRLGADWADMIHIANTAHADVFASFDKFLRKEAGAATPVAVELPFS